MLVLRSCHEVFGTVVREKPLHALRNRRCNLAISTRTAARLLTLHFSLFEAILGSCTFLNTHCAEITEFGSTMHPVPKWKPWNPRSESFSPWPMAYALASTLGRGTHRRLTALPGRSSWPAGSPSAWPSLAPLIHPQKPFR